MKRSLFSPALKKNLLAVPACALMLGAAHAGTTIGLNFQSWYYDSGANPQTIGFGQGYQTTGFPATATAFGLPVGNWYNTDPLPCSESVLASSTLFGSTGDMTGGSNTFAGTINLIATTRNMWESDIGNLVDPANEWTAGYVSSVAPGNDEITWSFEDNTGWTNTLSGLTTKFPNGYVMGLIGVSKCTASSRVVITDGATFTNSLGFNSIYTAGNANFHGPVGVLVTPTYTNDSITFGSVNRDVSSAQSCALGGFILTDKPVVVLGPTNKVVNQGGTLTLSASVIGLDTLAYQWQHAGTNVPGATTNPYSKVAAADDVGNWALVVTNGSGSATSVAAVITVNQIPLITTDLVTATNLIYQGDPVALSVVAGGANPLTYRWYRNGSLVSSGTNSVYVVSNLTAGLFGYSVVVSNQYSPPLANSSTNYFNVVATPDAYTAAVAADSPNSFWPLAETAGTTAYDYAGFSHDGTINNSMTLGDAGPQAPTFPGFNAATKAYLFDGSSAYIEGGTGTSLNGPTDFTVEAWVKTTAANNQIIAQQRDSSGAGFVGEYQFNVNANGTLSFFLYNNGYQGTITSVASVSDGNWHHVAAVRNGTAIYIYVDGAVSATGSGAVVNLSSTLRTYIGSDQRDHVAYFNGSMAMVAIYDHALSSGRLAMHYVIGSGAPLKLALVPGGMIQDSKPSGTLHPGQGANVGWTNSFIDPANVTRNGVGIFSQTSGSQIVTPADADFNATNGTISFWLAASMPSGPGSGGAMLFDRRTSSGSVIVLNADGSLNWQVFGGNPANTSFSAGSSLTDGNWHHIAVTYGQTTNDFVNVYIDGALVMSQAVLGNWSWPTGQQIEIGKSHDGFWKKLDGEMDDFRFYKRILTDTEVAQIYSSDALVDTSTLAVRYNFDNATFGKSVVWPFGTLQTSPTLGSGAVWTTLTNAVSPYPFLPSAPASFYRFILQ